MQPAKVLQSIFDNVDFSANMLILNIRPRGLDRLRGHGAIALVSSY
jgi:hypothetical protein